ncbi:MAG: ATPase, T2SS/T4P/T4SS family [Candidatus Micrarchaeia archaeon]
MLDAMRVLGKFYPMRQKTANVARSKMSFRVDDAISGNLVARNSINNTVIWKMGNQYKYDYNVGSISSAHRAALEMAKGAVIESLLGSDSLSYSKPLLEVAKSIALNYLNSLIPQGSNEPLASLVAHDTVGFGPISIIMEDAQNIDEIVINDPTSHIRIYHSTYGYCTTNMKFESEQSMRFVLNKMIAHTERELNSTNPVIDAEISNGSRLHAQMKPYAVEGVSASIRIGGKKSLDLKRLMSLGTISSDVLAYLWMALDADCNIVIAGAPGSGKTTLLNSLGTLLQTNERVITIEEELSEIRYLEGLSNVVHLQGMQAGGITTRSQVINALHLRPDRIVVGELRGSEASELFAGANLGVPFMTTLHSNGNGEYIVSRLESKPMLVDRSLLAMLDIGIFMKQTSYNSRVVSSIGEFRWLSRAELKGNEGSSWEFKELLDNNALKYESMGGSKVIEKYASLHGLKNSTAIKELKSRATFLKGMALSSESAASYISRYSVVT